MIDTTEQNAILLAILESPDFKDAKRYQDLLRYLVEETQSGRVPKEITIGMQFFGKDASFDPKEDPTVRVYLNNLRKKLEHYYLTNDPPTRFQLTIPKGHYEVTFIPRTEPPLAAVKQRQFSWPVSAALVIVTAFAVWLLTSPPPSPDPTEQYPLWKEFIAPGSRPTLVILGDYFFLWERPADRTTRNFVRNIDINSPDDFKEMVKKDPAFAERYVQSDFTFLRPSASWGLAQVLPALQHAPKGYSLKLASQFTVDDLKSNNIVFIGSFKSLYHLQKFLHVFGLKYSLSPNRVEVDTPNDSMNVFAPKQIQGGSYEKDFAVVAKGSGPDGCTLLLLLGFSDSGVIEAARAATDRAIVDSVVQRLVTGKAGTTAAFTMVVETEGFRQAIFKSDLRYLSSGSAMRPRDTDSSTAQ